MILKPVNKGAVAKRTEIVRSAAAFFLLKMQTAAQITVYECEDCQDCQHKAKCTKAQGNRKMQVSKKFLEKRQVSLENITSKRGILLRINRSIQVEGAFGVLKSDYNFDRFLTRGKNSVKNEFTLLCLGYNVNKLHAKIQTERVGQLLHQLKTA